MPTVGLQFETRSSDSPGIDSVWTCRSEQVAQMTSVATETWGLVFWSQGGTAHAAVTGPESRTGTAPVPEDATFVGIQFAVGTALRMATTASLVDGGIVLPDATRRTFWLDGHRWQRPHSEDAEALVQWLVRGDVVRRDPLVTQVVRGQGDLRAVSDRTLERRFRAVTGLSRGTVRQIERVRAAADLLTAGEVVSDVVDTLGYYDEPHLARALRRYVGRTAAQLREVLGGTIALDTGQRTTS
ncbi:helix-turn-helix domain-containing protein [Occultella kanbiaonis]|uniref:helix-turn-helix domain-containing protein n=1 Tax=Occultella kanbiaonis TaxID=2675754 RepID=UPI001B3551AD|nr:AraC family transcriptional regulator [Occultella kanbiaonis]